MAIAITNVTFNPGPLIQNVKTDNTTPVTVTLSADKVYRLKHLGLQEDLSTGATGAVVFTTNEPGGTLATVTGGLTGALGRGALVIQANNPNLGEVLVGPGVASISFLSMAGNPVVQLEPLRP